MSRRPERKPTPRPLYRNPIALAKEWQACMTGEGLTQAGLARKLGVSRARATQVLRLLDLEPHILHEIEDLGDPLPMKVVGERALRPLMDLPAKVRKRWATKLIRTARERLSSRAATDPGGQPLE